MNIVCGEPILEGWSSDKKYCITDEKGARFLLRISDILISYLVGSGAEDH